MFQLFDRDLQRFEEKMADLDRNLGSLVCQGFDDLDNVEDIFKVFFFQSAVMF